MLSVQESQVAVIAADVHHHPPGLQTDTRTGGFSAVLGNGLRHQVLELSDLNKVRKTIFLFAAQYKLTRYPEAVTVLAERPAQRIIGLFAAQDPPARKARLSTIVAVPKIQKTFPNFCLARKLCNFNAQFVLVINFLIRVR